MQSRIIIVMGVSGAGKTTLGERLAKRLALPFLEGDDFHPPENRARMANGIALTDEDRGPWLDALGTAIGQAAQRHHGVIASCSALRRAYRDRLALVVGQRPLFVFLDADRATLHRRMASRVDHFMPASLLESQLATLEPPQADEWFVTLQPETRGDTQLMRVVRALDAVESA